MPRKSRLSVVAAISAFAVSSFAASAQAGVLVASATDCEAQSMSQVFLPWADVANYVAQPGGSFERGTKGWTLGAASVVAGNEPWKVGDATDGKSLAIPAGTTVTTSAICVGLEHPTVRLFSTSAATLAHLDVEVLFEDAAGNVQSLPIGSVAAGAWAPSQIMVIGANLLAGLPGDRTAVAFRMTASGGDFRVDDVYVDPWSRT